MRFKDKSFLASKLQTDESKSTNILLIRFGNFLNKSTMTLFSSCILHSDPSSGNIRFLKVKIGGFDAFSTFPEEKSFHQGGTDSRNRLANVLSF